MFSKHLFRHKFDIDSLLAAWCNDTLPTNQTWLLNSETGEISAVASNYPESEFQHTFHPLPFQTTQQELLTLAQAPTLADDVKTELQTLLTTAQSMPELHAQFETGPAGGWLRQQIKNIILDWLDEREMIPPSMRHVRLDDTPSQPLTQAKVSIQ